MPIYRDKERGNFVFEFDRRLKGKRIRIRKYLPKTWNKSQADAFDREESARLYAIANNVERPNFLIDDAVNIYIEERIPLLKSGANIARELAQMYFAYKGRHMSELPQVCKTYLAKAGRVNEDNETPLAAATLRNRIRYLTSACRYAWKHHGMSEHDPAERVVAPMVRNERRRYISRKEMLQLCLASNHRPMRAAVRIAFYSGMRMSEILLAVRTEDSFILEDTKNGEPRIVPMHRKIRCCAKIMLPDQSRISKHFRDARRKVGLDWLHFHDLRHSAASSMINDGVDLYTVGAVLGHKTASSTKRYAHLATSSLKSAIDRIGKK
ncbi:integrase [Herbaspirillum sp. 1173]|uniref:tyrosine-type recombinase/integrase n=1 Tax=Herbaspirillum sp. 1173 TaxID=2817734 RepID=UPI00286338BE|nr:site-specific integrase [Herbaspirillum sp. 1173]MDR6740960.1 integrase [Herbaspirillum sp. 1173]